MRHSQLQGLTVGDDHPQYLRNEDIPGGSIPAGASAGVFLIWDVTTQRWIATTDIYYTTGISTLVVTSILNTGSNECTGNWLFNGGSGIKIEVVEPGPGARRFAVDTSTDRVEILAGQVVKRTAVSTTPYAVLAADYYLAIDTTAAITVTLPAANAVEGRVLIVKDAKGTGAGTNAITITPAGGDTTEVGSIGANRGFVVLISDGTSNWEAAIL